VGRIKEPLLRAPHEERDKSAASNGKNQKKPRANVREEMRSRPKLSCPFRGLRPKGRQGSRSSDGGGRGHSDRLHSSKEEASSQRPQLQNSKRIRRETARSGAYRGYLDTHLCGRRPGGEYRNADRAAHSKQESTERGKKTRSMGRGTSPGLLRAKSERKWRMTNDSRLGRALGSHPGRFQAKEKQ